jgi:hypothetical protein
VTCRIARLRSHARIVIVLMGAASAVGSPPPTPSAQARDLPLALASFCPVGGREGPCLQVDDPPGLEQLTPLHVAPGDVIVIRVGFQPTRLSLTVGSTGPIELAPSTAATWTVPAGFSAPPPGVLVSIFAEGQSAVATYRGRLET